MLYSTIAMAFTTVLFFGSLAHSFSLSPVGGNDSTGRQQQSLCDISLSRRCFVARSAVSNDDDDDTNENDTTYTMTPFESRIGGMRAQEEEQDEDEILGYAIDSFLRGDYNQPFADDAPSPHPGLSPGATVEAGLRSLRDLNSPYPSHGAAVLMRFCLPLTRRERWGDSSRIGRDPWKELLRGSLTPSMLARRLRASEFSGLLDWVKLDVTEGAAYCYPSSSSAAAEPGLLVDGLASRAFVNAALHFGDGIEPSLIQFTLRRVGGGVWLIDTARRSQRELFLHHAAEQGRDDS
jgi:hypothetical protein